MAIAALFMTENMDTATYDAIIVRLNQALGGSPNGRLNHTCFGSGDQLRVLDIWDSVENLNAFAGVLMPILAELGVVVNPPFVSEVHSQVPANHLVDRLRAAHDAFSAGNHEAAMGLVAPEVRFTDHRLGQNFATRQEFRGWLDAHKAMASDMQIVDAQYVVSGEWVTARFRAVGTQDGPLGPFPPSGKRFSGDICEVWHFNSNGEADEGHNYSDGTGLLAQLGHLNLG